MLRSFLAVLALCFSVFARAQELAYATALPPVTLAELASQPRLNAVSRVREHHFRRFPIDQWLASPLAGSGMIPSASPSIAAPPLTTSFASVGETEWAPADASGAAGRNHLVTASNSGVLVQNRSGERLLFVPLELFMAVTTPDSAYYFDPRIAYDAAADRWVIACIRGDGDDLLIAVSRSGDPQGTWSRYRLPFHSFTKGPIDFLRLEQTRDGIMIATWYEINGSTALLSVRKPELYATPAALPVTTYDFPFEDIVPVANDESGVQYVIHLAGIGRIGQPRSEWIPLEDACPFCGPSIYSPQKGSSRLLGNALMTIETAVFRNGAIYSVATRTSSGNSPRNMILWAKHNADTGRLLDSGVIDDPTGETFFDFPSLAVNPSGEMLIGFCTFGRDRYPSAGYAYRDAFGRVSYAGVLREGNSSYRRTPGGPAERWGDYTTTVVDPLSQHAFWTIQIIADATYWSTWWGKIETPAGRRRAVRR